MLTVRNTALKSLFIFLQIQTFLFYIPSRTSTFFNPLIRAVRSEYTILAPYDQEKLTNKLNSLLDDSNFLSNPKSLSNVILSSNDLFISKHNVNLLYSKYIKDTFRFK